MFVYLYSIHCNEYLPPCWLWAGLSVSKVRYVSHHPIIDLTQSHPSLWAARNSLKMHFRRKQPSPRTSSPGLWGQHMTGSPMGSSSHTLTQSWHSPHSPEPRSSPPQGWSPYPCPHTWPHPPHWHRPAGEDSASSLLYCYCHSEA